MTGFLRRMPRPPSWRSGQFRISRALATSALAILASVSAPRQLRAQDNSISGRVQVSGTNEPLPAAQISVSGSTQGAASDDQGRFRITGLTGSNVTLNVRRIGYRTTTVTARVGQTDLVISMVGNPTSLEAT